MMQGVRRLSGALVLAAVVFLLMACTSAPPSALGPTDGPSPLRIQTTPKGTASPVEAGTRGLRYVFDPSPPGVTPAISAHDALDSAGLRRGPHVHVGLFVFTSYVQRDSSGILFDHRLVWHLWEDHMACIPGSMGGCDHTEGAIVDATTGERLFSYVGPLR